MLNNAFSTQRLVQETSKLPKSVLVTTAVWLLTMISLPIVNWTLGAAALRQGVAFAVVLQATAVLLILDLRWERTHIAFTFATIAGITLLVEIIGSATGFPFGDYHYTAWLQPQIQHVPLLIPLAWFMMLPPSWAVAYRFRENWLLFAAVSALALTAWDLLLDPQMVQWQLWVWDQPGAYFGIPLLNYFGWFMTAFVLTLILRPSALELRPLLIIYTITWFLETFGLLFFWGLAGPAVVGGVVMGSFVWLGWRQGQL